MCYLAHQRHAAAAQPDAATPPSRMDSWRPRLAGALATVAIGGLALAALLVPMPTAPALQVKAPERAAPMSVQPPELPVSLKTPDDGVPTALDGPVAAGRDCHHGL